MHVLKDNTFPAEMDFEKIVAAWPTSGFLVSLAKAILIAGAVILGAGFKNLSDIRRFFDRMTILAILLLSPSASSGICPGLIVISF